MKDIDLCPYCGEKMRVGSIYGDRYPLKWIAKENDKGFLLQWFSRGIKLTSSFLDKAIESFYCERCKKIIIDVEDTKDGIKDPKKEEAP